MATYRSFLYLSRWAGRAIKKTRKAIEIIRHKHGYCPRCKGVLLIRAGKYGKFLGCSNYPECKYTKNFT